MNRDPTAGRTIRAIAYQEGDLWIVQGLEYNIVTRARSMGDVPSAFVRALVERVHIGRHLGIPPFDGLEPAPERFERLYEQATRPETVTPPPGIEAERMEIRLLERAA